VRLGALALLGACAWLSATASSAPALLAGNAVGSSAVGRYQSATTANTLKPSQCASLTLSTVVAGVTGTSGSDLLLGSAAADSVTGGNGNDCILGGGGNDSINGGPGTDVCIGGPGTDTFSNCETQIQ
jgi:Ca2+-binding RTX toxin-like protein